MFGRATITLGIGPHSSIDVISETISPAIHWSEIYKNKQPDNRNKRKNTNKYHTSDLFHSYHAKFCLEINHFIPHILIF